MEATSSSVDYNGPARKAIDGKDNGGIYVNNALGVCAHTLEKRASWIKLDLGASKPVDHVQLVGRSDCCKEQSRRWTIRVGNSGWFRQTQTTD